MSKIVFSNGEVRSFSGDAIIFPCSTNLTNSKFNPAIELAEKIENTSKTYHRIINFVWHNNKNELDNLLQELASIGSCSIGNAVITRSHHLNVKNIIFLPVINDKEDRSINNTLFHKGLRSAFGLASVYNLKRLAIPITRKKGKNKDFFDKIVAEFSNKEKGLDKEDMKNILLGISREFKTIKEVYIFE